MKKYIFIKYEFKINLLLLLLHTYLDIIHFNPYNNIFSYYTQFFFISFFLYDLNPYIVQEIWNGSIYRN